MCTFCSTSELPSHEKGKSKTKNSFISLFLKANKENEQYRFRLLFYRQPSKNDRKDAYITQKIHDHWGTSANGIKIIDDYVVCPGTDYVHYDDEKFIVNPNTNKKELNCPICQKVRENFAAYLNSGKTDKLSLKKAYQLKAKDRVCIPVYVINDPNNEKNNGKFKVLILTNPEDIKLFQKTVDDEKTKAYLASKDGHGYEVFNGGNAVDLYIRVENVPEVRNQGKENEYVAHVRKITNIAFGKKTQQINAINKDAIDGFEFDDQFYFSNTKNELEMFYKKYFGQDDISPDEEDVFGGSTPSVTQQNTEHTETENVSSKENIVSTEELDEVICDDTDEPVFSETTEKKHEELLQIDKSSDDETEDLDKILAELG